MTDSNTTNATDELVFRALSPEERAKKEQELADHENSDPMVCVACGS
jgi:hypothetical protein